MLTTVLDLLGLALLVLAGLTFGFVLAGGIGLGSAALAIGLVSLIASYVIDLRRPRR